MGFLVEAEFSVRYVYHRIKDSILGELVFCLDTIMPIKHVVICRYTCQRKQEKIGKYIIREKSTLIKHDHRVDDQVFLTSKAASKYETSFIGA